ncbi:hypothetical protein BGZ57DRAFT_649631 [Hyaloscypha finlandica]|nr:hypothetical protein BGZ57DRAFT_649631 [Hyaloscypha finlandica]
MGQAELGTDTSKEVALEVLCSPSRNPPPRPATSVQQATRLLEGSRALLSDLSILHDEFTSVSHPSKTDVILSLTGSPHATLELVSKLCANVDALRKRLYNRELLEKDDPRSCFISDTEVAEAATIEASTDQSLLNGLAVEYCTMRRDITRLRGYLEEAHRNEAGHYKYKREVRFQVIGNQACLSSYKHQKPIHVPFSGPASPNLAQAIQGVSSKKGGHIERSLSGSGRTAPIAPMFSVIKPTMIPLQARHIDLKPKKEVKKMKKNELRDELKERMRENSLLKLDVAKLRGEVVELSDDGGEI